MYSYLKSQEGTLTKKPDQGYQNTSLKEILINKWGKKPAEIWSTGKISRKVSINSLYSYSNRPSESLCKGLCLSHFQWIDFTSSYSCKGSVRAKRLCHSFEGKWLINEHEEFKVSYLMRKTNPLKKCPTHFSDI